MAKQMRMITASCDTGALIDRGFDVDVQIKNLGLEDKGIKSRINEGMPTTLQEGETSLKIEGIKAIAVITVVEKYEIDANAETFPVVRQAVDNGLLADVVEKTQQLAVPASDIEKAAKILKDAGIKAMVAEAFAINAESFRKISASGVLSTEQLCLSKCVSKTTTYRVKYDRNPNYTEKE